MWKEEERTLGNMNKPHVIYLKTKISYSAFLLE